MQTNVETKIYEFDGFRLEGAQHRLMHNGRPVSLKPKILDLLLFLVEKRGQLVGKADLLREVWPNTIVEENNITVSMSLLRKTLAEYVKDVEFIETVPRRGYRFLAEVTEIRDQRATADGIPDTDFDEEPIDSLAVLPLESAANDPSIEYLSEGITESLINKFSRIPRLRVPACSTVFRLNRKQIDPQEVGKQLNVRAVMMIRVIRLSENLIIRGELVNVADGSQLWGEQYNRGASDILTTQYEIAKAISDSLRFKLDPQDQMQLSKQPTHNADAYNLYLRGRYFWHKYSKDGALKAIELFEEAIRIDEKYALAYCGIADAYFRLSNVHSRPIEVLPKAKEAALKAVEIDENLAEAHSSLGLIKLYYDHDWTGAESEYRRAIKLNSNLSSAHQRLGTYFTYLGAFEEAIRCYDRALELEPFSLQINTNRATTYYLMGEYDRAINALQQTSELEPNYMPVRFVWGWVYIQQNRLDEAIEEFQSIYKSDNEAYLALGFMGYAHALAGHREEAETVLNILQEISERMYVSPYSMLVIHLALGPEKRVFELLQQISKEHNEWVVWLNVSPELKVLRSDSRFKKLLKDVGFPE